MSDTGEQTIKYVFPDTNIFLHYRTLDEIDLPILLDSHHVIVVVASVIINELDTHKWDHPIAGIRKRADASTKRILNWSKHKDKVIRSNMTLELCNHAKPDTITNNRLDERSKDDQLLGCILEYQVTYGRDKVYLLTADIGPQLKANKFQLNVLEPSEKHKLPHAQDARQQEILRLQRQLAEYRGRMPALTLSFEGGVDTQSVVIRPSSLLTSQQINSKLAKLKSESDLPYIESESFKRKATDSLSAAVAAQLALGNSWAGPSPEEIERYKREFTEYLEKYKQYLRRRNDLDNRARRTMKFAFELSNEGTAFAEEVLVTFILPKKLKWSEEVISYMERPKQPTPPLPPRSRIDALNMMPQDIFSPLSDHNFGFGNHFNFLEDVSGPYFQGNILEWPVDECRHNGTIKLGSIYAYFLAGEPVSDFDIQYTIGEKNTPSFIKGRLLVNVSQENEQTSRH